MRPTTQPHLSALSFSAVPCEIDYSESYSTPWAISPESVLLPVGPSGLHEWFVFSLILKGQDTQFNSIRFCQKWFAYYLGGQAQGLVALGEFVKKVVFCASRPPITHLFMFRAGVPLSFEGHQAGFGTGPWYYMVYHSLCWLFHGIQRGGSPFAGASPLKVRETRVARGGRPTRESDGTSPL